MPQGLLEPRLYRATFVVALLALVVLAFSLRDGQRARTSEPVPPTFSAQRVLATARQMVVKYGVRASGTRQDEVVAELVKAQLEESGFVASTYRFGANTLRGERELVNVLGVRAGPTDRRLVIVASRDGAPGALRQTGTVETGMLVELARVLQGRAFSHTLVLASVSGGADGGLGAAELARKLRRPVDGVVVLRNIAARRQGTATLARYDSRLRSDPRFVQTLAQVSTREFGGGESNSVSGQLVRMGFPLALGEQAGFPAQGLSAVALSPGGEALAPADFARGTQVAAGGRAALRALTTLDGDFRPAAPRPADLQIGGKLIPSWALILFIGTLLLPLVVVAVDGWARARRRDEASLRGLVAPPLALAPLIALALLLRALGAVGLIDAPPLPAEPEAATAMAPVVIGVCVVGLAVAGMLVAVAAARQFTPKGGEAGFALWLAFAGIALFAVNPVAAAFWLLPLHLMMLLLLAGTKPRRAQVWLTLLAGLVPVVIAAAYYPVVLGIDLPDVLRFAVLLLAGGFIGVTATAVGCMAVAATFAAALQLHWTAPMRSRPSPSPSPLLR